MAHVDVADEAAAHVDWGKYISDYYTTTRDRAADRAQVRLIESTLVGGTRRRRAHQHSRTAAVGGTRRRRRGTCLSCPRARDQPGVGEGLCLLAWRSRA